MNMNYFYTKRIVKAIACISSFLLVRSPEGNLLVDDPKVLQGIIESLDWYSQFYLQGENSPEAINWNNADNNRQFLNQEILTTTNATLLIPAALRQDQNAYRDRLGIVELSNKPNGEPMKHIFLVEQAVIFNPHFSQKGRSPKLRRFLLIGKPNEMLVLKCTYIVYR